MVELTKHVPSTAVTVAATNPGFSSGSPLQRHMAGTLVGFLFKIYTSLVGRSATVGARSLVDAAVAHG